MVSAGEEEGFQRVRDGKQETIRLEMEGYDFG